MRSILYRKFIHINDQILFTVVKRKSNHPRRTKNEHKNLVVVDNIYIYKYLQGCVFNLFCIIRIKIHLVTKCFIQWSIKLDMKIHGLYYI